MAVFTHGKKNRGPGRPAVEPDMDLSLAGPHPE